MKKLTPEEHAQADACDREKLSLYPWMHYRQGETSPDGRMLESDPQYEILQRAKERKGM